MPPAGFETAIPAGGRQQTNALDRAATGIGIIHHSQARKYNWDNKRHKIADKCMREFQSKVLDQTTGGNTVR